MDHDPKKLKAAYDNAMKIRSKTDSWFIECPECHKGVWGGMFHESCNNPECILYVEAWMDRCGKCNEPRRECCC